MADHTERPPPSKRAKCLGTPPLESQPPKLDSDAAPSAMHLSVEAFGSGVLLHPDLAVSTDQTVGDLRQSVFSAVNCPSNTRSIRLFVGHGGTELDNDTLLVADSAIAGEDDKPLVMFPTIWRDQDVLAACGWRRSQTVTTSGVRPRFVDARCGHTLDERDNAIRRQPIDTPITRGWRSEKATASLVGSDGRIKTLMLNEKRLHGRIPTEIGLLTAVREMYLTNNELTGHIPTEIGQLTSVAQISLSRNRFTGCIPTEVGHLTAVIGFRLHGNMIGGCIPSEFGQLSMLTELRLHSNQLDGPIPTTIGQLVALESLELCRNQLSGCIPSEIGRLKRLSSLNLSGNRLSGRIPTELGQLTGLKTMWLSSNRLTGTIPTELARLTHLSEVYESAGGLNLSQNRLTGKPKFRKLMAAKLRPKKHFRL